MGRTDDDDKQDVHAWRRFFFFFFFFTQTLTHTSSGAFDFNHQHMPALGACFLFYM